MNDLIAQIRFDDAGLVPVITQDAESGQVLMFAWMNSEAFMETVRSQQAVYFSRSRQRLWRKGESSGHTQQVRELRLDCDGDVILMRVDQIGGIACHTGRAHCFFRVMDASGKWQECEPVVKSPEDIYGSET